MACPPPRTTAATLAPARGAPEAGGASQPAPERRLARSDSRISDVLVADVPMPQEGLGRPPVATTPQPPRVNRWVGPDTVLEPGGPALAVPLPPAFDPVTTLNAAAHVAPSVSHALQDSLQAALPYLPPQVADLVGAQATLWGGKSAQGGVNSVQSGADTFAGEVPADASSSDAGVSDAGIAVGVLAVAVGVVGMAVTAQDARRCYGAQKQKAACQLQAAFGRHPGFTREQAETLGRLREAVEDRFSVQLLLAAGGQDEAFKRDAKPEATAHLLAVRAEAMALGLSEQGVRAYTALLERECLQEQDRLVEAGVVTETWWPRWSTDARRANDGLLRDAGVRRAHIGRADGAVANALNHTFQPVRSAIQGTGYGAYAAGGGLILGGVGAGGAFTLAAGAGIIATLSVLKARRVSHACAVAETRIATMEAQASTYAAWLDGEALDAPQRALCESLHNFFQAAVLSERDAQAARQRQLRTLAAGATASTVSSGASVVGGLAAAGVVGGGTAAVVGTLGGAAAVALVVAVTLYGIQRYGRHKRNRSIETHIAALEAARTELHALAAGSALEDTRPLQNAMAVVEAAHADLVHAVSTSAVWDEENIPLSHDRT